MTERGVVLLVLGLFTLAVIAQPSAASVPSSWTPLPEGALRPLPAASLHLASTLPVVTATPVATPTPTRAPKPKPATKPARRILTGYATWYDDGPGIYAAAGPALRRALGNWRGRAVTICAGTRCVRVVLSDWCACGPRHGYPTLLDLSIDAFSRLGSPGRGVLLVEYRR